MDAQIGDPTAKAWIVRFLRTHLHVEQVSEAEDDLTMLLEAPANLFSYVE